jgi:predicted lipid-binding transport protein (Tim44 family)
MKAFLVALMVGVVSISLAPTDADARRLGGGGGFGMQRSMPARTPPAAAPAQTPPTAAAPAAVPGTQAAAAGAAPRRSWMGPIAGLAAGLGIAALMSHLGMGAEFANFLMIALLALAAIFAIRLVMRRFAPTGAARAGNGMQYAGSHGAWPRAEPSAGPAFGSGSAAAPASTLPAPATASSTTSTLPAGFDAAGFERVAKMIFIRLQAANDSGDLNDLRNFTTPEMFAAVKMDLQDRNGAKQQTDVVRIDAEVLDVATESDRQIVSVRFHGLIREELDGVAAPFDEVWHLVRPTDGSREWAIAGIQQMA